MRDLTEKELLMVSGAGDPIVSPETVGGAIGGYAGGLISMGAGAVGIVVGAAAANILVNGKREVGSVSTSGIPWGASWGPGTGSSSAA